MKITLKGNHEYIIGLVIVFCLFNKGFGQELKHKELEAVGTTQNLRIDGKLDEKCWQQGSAATDFVPFILAQRCMIPMQPIFRMN
jgi:hypothetical protein